METQTDLKTHAQLEEAIDRLIKARYGNDVNYLLQVIEPDSGCSTSLTNNAMYMFDYGAILFGKFCEDVLTHLHEKAKLEVAANNE